MRFVPALFVTLFFTTAKKSWLKICLAIFPLLLGGKAFSEDDLQWKSNIEMQGEKSIYTDKWGNNLDALWGRLNIGAETHDSEWESKFNIRIYPEGFGYASLTGITFDTLGQGSVKTQSSSVSKVQINHAWVKYTTPLLSLRVGRFETKETNSEHFGNYVDQSENGQFKGRNATHNAVEGINSQGNLSVSAMLGTNDPNLNRGFIRLYVKYHPLEAVKLSIAYKSNLFDKFYYENENILNRFDFGANYVITTNCIAYIESGLIQQANIQDDQIPTMFGITFPFWKLLDAAAIEFEFDPNRQVDKKDKPVFFNLYGKKTLFGRAIFEGGLFSDATHADFMDIGLAGRLTGVIR